LKWVEPWGVRTIRKEKSGAKKEERPALQGLVEKLRVEDKKRKTLGKGKLLKLEEVGRSVKDRCAVWGIFHEDGKEKRKNIRKKLKKGIDANF